MGRWNPALTGTKIRRVRNGSGVHPPPDPSLGGPNLAKTATPNLWSQSKIAFEKHSNFPTFGGMFRNFSCAAYSASHDF